MKSNTVHVNAYERRYPKQREKLYAVLCEEDRVWLSSGKTPQRAMNRVKAFESKVICAESFDPFVHLKKVFGDVKTRPFRLSR